MSFWDRIANVYDIAESFNSKVYTEMCDTTRRLVPSGAKVLDCAAGTGELTFAAALKAESVVCTDLSENMLKTAKRKALKRGFSNITFEERNIFELKDPDCTYDIVIAGNVLHLVDNPKDAVKELYRVTKCGGKILLPTFTTRNKGQNMVKLYRMIGFNPSESYSPSMYRDMLRECVEEINAVNTSNEKADLHHKLIRGTLPCCYAVISKPEK